MKTFTVLYDEHCPLCRRCRDWMRAQPSIVPVRFLGAHSDEAQQKYRALPWLGYELVVVADTGEAWVGPAAFVMSLWLLRDYQQWAYRMSGETFAPMAERFFRMLSHRRKGLARFFDDDDCADGRCRTCAP